MWPEIKSYLFDIFKQGFRFWDDIAHLPTFATAVWTISGGATIWGLSSNSEVWIWIGAAGILFVIFGIGPFLTWKKQKIALEKLAEKVESRLILEFIPDKSGLCHISPIHEGRRQNQIWIRGHVRNPGVDALDEVILKLCRLDKISPDGSQSPIITEEMELNWTNHGPGAIRLHNDEIRHFDLANGVEGFDHLIVRIYPYKNPPILMFKGTYRAEVKAMAKNSRSKTLDLEIIFSGTFEGLSVNKIA